MGCGTNKRARQADPDALDTRFCVVVEKGCMMTARLSLFRLIWGGKTANAFKKTIFHDLIQRRGVWARETIKGDLTSLVAAVRSELSGKRERDTEPT